MKAAVILLLCASQAGAATITITVTGTTGQIKVGEGPIFDHSSYQSIPPGAPFALTYTFDDEQGKQSITATDGGLITQSQAEDSGVNAVLQIGTAVWEFGASSRSHVVLNSEPGNASDDILYTTRGGGNRISARVTPAKGGYWPKSGDWRSSFTATSIDGSTAEFFADNDRVSASGKLVPTEITVSGVDLDGQWLRATDEHTWQLAHPSPMGGYIVAEVNRVVRGTEADGSPITPAQDRYWQAWRVPAGATVPAQTTDASASTHALGSTGEENVTVVARFYEGLSLPAVFNKLLWSAEDPMLSTRRGTLPADFRITRSIANKR